MPGARRTTTLNLTDAAMRVLEEPARQNDLSKTAVHLPETLAQELEAAVQSGRFSDESDVVRQALREFLHRQQRALEQQFQRGDITWALQAKEASQPERDS